MPVQSTNAAGVNRGLTPPPESERDPASLQLIERVEGDTELQGPLINPAVESCRSLCVDQATNSVFQLTTSRQEPPLPTAAAQALLAPQWFQEL